MPFIAHCPASLPLAGSKKNAECDSNDLRKSSGRESSSGTSATLSVRKHGGGAVKAGLHQRQAEHAREESHVLIGRQLADLLAAAEAGGPCRRRRQASAAASIEARLERLEARPEQR